LQLFFFFFNRSHTVFATSFFAIAAHQWLQPHFNLFCNNPYFHQVAFCNRSTSVVATTL
jgi:hypothetical protein